MAVPSSCISYSDEEILTSKKLKSDVYLRQYSMIDNSDYE